MYRACQGVSISACRLGFLIHRSDKRRREDANASGDGRGSPRQAQAPLLLVPEVLMEMVDQHVEKQSSSTESVSPLSRDERYAMAWYTSDVRDLGLGVESNWWFVVNRLLRERNMKDFVVE